jgi:hypothetical protein
MNRKVWKKPKLIVLVRGRPEEAVLQACKSDSVGGPGGGSCAVGNGYAPCSAVTPT